MVWRRLRPYFCVRLILLNSMFSNFCHVLNIPTLKGNLHAISTRAQSLGVYTFVDVHVKDGPLMKVLRQELPKLKYYQYNSGGIQFELGYLTQYGQGCDRDIEAAIKYYTAAYKDGNVLACNLLGWIFRQGDGVTVDLIQAVEWYSRGSQMVWFLPLFLRSESNHLQTIYEVLSILLAVFRPSYSGVKGGNRQVKRSCAIVEDLRNSLIIYGLNVCLRLNTHPR